MPKNKTQQNTILPPQTIGIIGGGQLGRMMALSARKMGYKIIVLDPTPNCPTAQVADEQIIANYDEMDAIELLTKKSDVVTYEFENVDAKAAQFIESKGKLPQGARALEVTQNRAKEKMVMREAGLPVAPFAIVETKDQCDKALDEIPLPAVVKTCRGGYDGKGQLKINTAADRDQVYQFIEERGGTFIIEQWISFQKEISVVFTRAQNGKMTIFPLAENIHRDHILHETIAPARVAEQIREKAYDAANTLAKELDVIGTFAIEMFVKDDEIFINEMAPRPHNSGHYTIEACNVSQFSQHIRAICNVSLPTIKQLQSARMINVLGEHMPQVLQALTTKPQAHVHLYGKAEAKEKRKMGHVTFIGDDEQQVKSYRDEYEEAQS